MSAISPPSVPTTPPTLPSPRPPHPDSQNLTPKPFPSVHASSSSTFIVLVSSQPPVFLPHRPNHKPHALFPHPPSLCVIPHPRLNSFPNPGPNLSDVTTPAGGVTNRHGFPRYLNIRHVWWKTVGAEAKDVDSQEGKTINRWCNVYDTRFCAVFQLVTTFAALDLCTPGFLSRDGGTDASGKEQVRLSAYWDKVLDTATNKDGGLSWWTVWCAEGGARASWTPPELELAFQPVLNHSGLGVWSVGGKPPGFSTPHSIRASAVAWAGRCGSAMAGSVLRR